MPPLGNGYTCFLLNCHELIVGWFISRRVASENEPKWGCGYKYMVVYQIAKHFLSSAFIFRGVGSNTLCKLFSVECKTLSREDKRIAFETCHANNNNSLMRGFTLSIFDSVQNYLFIHWKIQIIKNQQLWIFFLLNSDENIPRGYCRQAAHMHSYRLVVCNVHFKLNVLQNIKDSVVYASIEGKETAARYILVSLW